MIRFSEVGHRYKSIVPDERNWISVTTFWKQFYKPFDRSIADKNSEDITSKWYGIKPNEIRAIWDKEAKRSTDLGTWYHKMREDQEIEAIQCCPIEENWKYAGDQKLIEGIYPELMLYHPEYNVCGQSDRVEIKNRTILISDYKSNKTISTSGFRGKKMLYPIYHLDDCDYIKYSLQLSTYMYMIEYHNVDYTPGQLEIQHVQFEIESLDKWGYPIVRRDKNGDPVVKQVTPIKVDYMKKEVEKCLQYLKETESKRQYVITNE